MIELQARYRSDRAANRGQDSSRRRSCDELTPTALPLPPSKGPLSRRTGRPPGAPVPESILATLRKRAVRGGASAATGLAELIRSRFGATVSPSWLDKVKACGRSREDRLHLLEDLARELAGDPLREIDDPPRRSSWAVWRRSNRSPPPSSSGTAERSSSEVARAAEEAALALRLCKEARIASRYPDGKLYFDLATAGVGPETTLAAMRHVIRKWSQDEKVQDVDLPGQSRRLLSSRKVILLLDNAQNANRIARLTPPAGSLMVVTSRGPFVAGPCSVRLAGLPLDQAVRYLGLATPAGTREGAAIAQLCRLGNGQDGCLPPRAGAGWRAHREPVAARRRDLRRAVA